MTTSVLDFEITAFFFGAALCCYLRSILENAPKQRFFYLYCLFVTLGAAVDVLGAGARPLPVPDVLHRLLAIAAQTCALLAIYWYVLYLLHFSETFERGERLLRVLYRAGLALYLPLQLLCKGE